MEEMIARWIRETRMEYEGSINKFIKLTDMFYGDFKMNTSENIETLYEIINVM